MLLASFALAAPPSPDAVTALTGDWRLAEPRPVVQARVDAAVDAMLAPYNLVIRNIARPLVVKAATFCDSYRTRLTTASFTLDCRPTGEITVPFDSPGVSGVSADGNAYSVTARYDGTAVRLEFAGEAGVQKVRYWPGNDGSFRVEKTLHAERLESDVTWEMKYLRQ